jgi:hypothetical protein
MKKDLPKRGGGVVLAAQFTRIREVLDKSGNVVKRTVQKPKEEGRVKNNKK